MVVEYLEQRYKQQGVQLIPEDAAQAAKVIVPAVRVLQNALAGYKLPQYCRAMQ